VYKLYSQNISQSAHNQQAARNSKLMKAFRRDILKLIQIYITNENNYHVFNTEFLPTLKGLVDDYQQGTPESRDAEVLTLFATMFKQLGHQMNDFL